MPPTFFPDEFLLHSVDLLISHMIHQVPLRDASQAAVSLRGGCPAEAAAQGGSAPNPLWTCISIAGISIVSRWQRKESAGERLVWKG